MPRLPGKRPRLPKQKRTKKPRIDIRIGQAFDIIRDVLNTEMLSDKEQTILKRIQDIHTGKKSGILRETDLKNMKNIAKRHGIRF